MGQLSWDVKGADNSLIEARFNFLAVKSCPSTSEIGSIMIMLAIANAIIIITLFTRMNRASMARRMALNMMPAALRVGQDKNNLDL